MIVGRDVVHLAPPRQLAPIWTLAHRLGVTVDELLELTLAEVRDRMAQRRRS